MSALPSKADIRAAPPELIAHHLVNQFLPRTGVTRYASGSGCVDFFVMPASPI
jgi:hypothetical protein